MSSDYTVDDLHEDIWLLYKAGLIDVSMREDGEWLFTASEASLNMSPEELERAVALAGEEQNKND